MSDLATFVRRLIEALRARDPLSVHVPVSIADLRRSVLPYRIYRTALGLTSLEDYELLVLRLCAEEGGYVRTFPPDAVDRCREELASPNPDLGIVDDLDEVTIQIGAASLARLAAGDLPAGQAAAAAAPPAAVEAPPPASGGSPTSPPDAPLAPSPVAVPPPASRATVSSAQLSDRCRHCAATLPSGQRVVYCPFCGYQLLPVRCPGCGTEFEPGWRFCITCGQPGGGAGVKV